ncbi:MAG: DUF6785 family protein, partial [Armatimonadota bacterium]
MAVEEHSKIPLMEPSVKEETTVADRGVTPRSLIIGFIVIVPGVFWGVYGDVVSQTDLTSMSLMMPPVLILTLLLLINSIIKRYKPSLALSRSELITIYVMLTVSVIMSGMGMIQFLCTALGAVPHFKTPENQWESYLSLVPPQIMPKLSAIDGFYKGNSRIPWSAWTWPIMLWSGFLFAMLFCMTCINNILRKQWIERERLIFPIVQLPLEMTDPKTSFFRNRVMWLGFGIAAGLETLNSFAALFPNVPSVQLKAFDLQPFFTNAPWNAIGYFPTTFYPLAIGLGFVLSIDVSFSCWFFYIMTKLENVFVSAIGWTGGAGGTVSSPPYLGQQGVGAFIGIVIMVIYLARNHLKDLMRKVIHSDPSVDDSEEPMSYKTAIIGLVGGFGVMVAFAVFVGMSPLVALAYLGIYLIFATTISRIRAEAGPAWTMGPDLSGMDTLVQSVGSNMFSQRNLVALAYFNWFSIEMRCCPMPTTIEGMKMAQMTRIRQKTMTIVMLAAIVMGIAIGFWACLAVWYKFGAGTAKVEPWRTWMGAESFARVNRYIANPK